MAQKLYLECTSGISGDMAVAALLDVGEPEEKAEREQLVLKALCSLPVQGFDIRISRVVKSGLDACDFDVVLDAAHENHDHDMEYLHGHSHVHAHSHDRHAHEHEHPHGHSHEHRRHEHAREHARPHDHDHANRHGHDHGHSHEHRNLADVTAIINAADMSDGAKRVACRIFEIIAEAEAKAHGEPIDRVHFHEVGAIDSIADIVAVSVCFDHLGVDDVVVTELSEGKGTVRCQHGVIPVPVPAVATISSRYGIPLRLLNIEGELVTPTGAAIVAALRTETQLPDRFVIKSVGLGAGKRAYETPGIVRAMIIESV